MISSNYFYFGGPQCKKQRKRKKRQVCGPCQRTKKAVKHESNGDTNCNWHTWNGPQKFGEEAGRVGNRRTQTTAWIRSARILRSVLES